MQKSFFGYRRDNGRVGIRNHVLILPLDDLSQPACDAVANNIGGTVAIQHPYGRLQFGAEDVYKRQGKEANRLGRPVVFDPVGVGASQMCIRDSLLRGGRAVAKDNGFSARQNFRHEHFFGCPEGDLLGNLCLSAVRSTELPSRRLPSSQSFCGGGGGGRFLKKRPPPVS